jgi:hypothetical protein
MIENDNLFTKVLKFQPPDHELSDRPNVILPVRLPVTHPNVGINKIDSWGSGPEDARLK